MFRRAVLPVLVAATLSASTAWADYAAAMAGGVSQASYTNYLDNVLYTHTGDDRGWGAEHDLARDAIFSEFVSFGLEASLDPFYYSGATCHNVVGVLNGSSRADEIYVIGAHYDSFSNPGADDNASGVAGMLEIARVASAFDFDATIMFIAFDREEQGRCGSSAWVTYNNWRNIRGMISMDMIAYDPYDRSRAHLYSTDFSNNLRIALQDALLRYGGISADMPLNTPYSDHTSFEFAGFPATLLIEYDPAGNPYYHTLGDTVDTPGYINYAYATRMTSGVAGWIAAEGGAHAVPEPGTLMLLAIGIPVLLQIRRRQAA